MPASQTLEQRIFTAAQPRTRPMDAWRSYLPIVLLAAARGAAVGGQFLAQLAVGVLAGAAALGILQLVVAWTCMVGEVIAQGLPARVMRQVSVEYAARRGDVVRVVVRNAAKRVVLGWLVTAGVLGLLFFALRSMFDLAFVTAYSGVLLATFVAAPLFALLRISAEALKSMDRTLLAVSIESLVSPVTLLIVCLLCWLSGRPLLAGMLVGAFVLSVVLSVFGMWRALERGVKSMGAPEQTCKRTTLPAQKDLLSLWASSVLGIVFLNMPFLVLPLYASAAEVGVYSLAHKLVNVITTLLLLLSAIYGPVFARAAAKGDRAVMGITLRRTQLISTAIFLPSSLLILACAVPLAQLFGPEFGSLPSFLAILVLGQALNAITGLGGVMLTMAGAASLELCSLAAALAFGLVASYWVAEGAGALGLAILFSACIGLKNLVSYLLALRLLHTMDTLS